MDELIIDLYKKGFSIAYIVDKIFKINKNNIPKNESFNNFFLYKDRGYNRLDCNLYVSKVILNYNNSIRK